MRNRFGIAPFLGGMTLLFDADGGGGGSNADPPAPRNAPSDILARYDGDSIRMAEQVAKLQGEKFDMREQRRDLNAEIETLKSKMPGEGRVVLTKEQAEQWEAYQKLGKPDEAAKVIEDGKSAQARVSSFEREQILDKAAKAENFRPNVLKLLAKDATVQEREVDVKQEDGSFKKAPQFVVVTITSDGGEGEQKKDTQLREYFKAQGDDVLTSLEAGEANQNGTPPQGDGTPYPSQPAGSAPTNSNYTSLVSGRYDHNAPKVEKP